METGTGIFLWFKTGARKRDERKLWGVFSYVCVLAGNSSGNKGGGGHVALHYFLASGGCVVFLFVHQFCCSESLALGFLGGRRKRDFLNIRAGLISYVYCLALFSIHFLSFLSVCRKRIRDRVVVEVGVVPCSFLFRGALICNDYGNMKKHFPQHTQPLISLGALLTAYLGSVAD